MQIRRRELAAPVMDLTPLIDVLFQVLVFLIMTSSFVNLGTIPVNLPNSSTSGLAESVPSVVLESKGTLRLGDRPIEAAQLTVELTALLSGLDDKNVSVIADRDVPLKLLITAMDSIRSAGGEGVMVVTEN